MKIGIIGSGNIGSTLGRHLVKAGHTVMFAARDTAKPGSLVDELGAHAALGSPAQAASFGEVVIVATPYKAWPDIGRELASQLAGKVAIDAANPYPQRDGPMANEALAKGHGSGESTARFIPGARVVKAFNTLHWEDLAHRAGTGLGMAIAGDDPAALEIVSGLTRDVGFVPVPAGSLADSGRFDPGQPAYGKPMSPAELGAALAASR